MSVYNGKKWLEEAISSIVAQTFTDFEFIVVDDGSIDDSLSIAQSWARKDDRIAVFSKTNTGLTDSLNFGLVKASGTWIARQDADDVSAPDRLERQFLTVSRNPRLVLLGTSFSLIDANGINGKYYSQPECHKRLKARLVSGGRFFPHSSAMFRRDAAMNVGCYRRRFDRSQDRDLWLRLSQYGEIGCLNENLVGIRKHSTQISNQDGGRTQRLCSLMSLTSNCLRGRKMEDPVDANEEVYGRFKAWLEKHPSVTRLIEAEEAFSKVRASANNEDFTKFNRMKTAILLSVIGFRALLVRVSIPRMVRSIAAEWSGRNKS